MLPLHRIRTACVPAIAATLAALAPPVPAGGSGENVLLIVDPTDPASLHVANHYKEARDVPDANVLYLGPAASYAEFTGAHLGGFLGELARRGIGDHVDFVVLATVNGFYVAAPGYVSDTCSPVTRFAAPTPFTLAHRAADILDGIGSQRRNRYNKSSWEPQYFDSELRWLNGDPSTAPGAQRYYIGAQLGYTGANGSTKAEVLAMIDRSVAVDATHPAGTFYFMATADPARSDPRDGSYAVAVTQLLGAGAGAEQLFDWLPFGRHDALGIMTGFAAWDIDGADLTLLPGAFADHLTSYAATFDDVSQTKMTRWIAKGASGTAGTVEEPCNYAGKFPHARLHSVYRKGLTLGEAWFRSLEYEPFQNLFLGDPLTRPWAHPPAVDVLDEPLGPVSGTILLTPAAMASAPGAAIARLELLVDGVLRATSPGGPFLLDTTRLDDGWHELRVVALDDTPARHGATWKGALEVANHARTAALAVLPTSGDLGTAFALTPTAVGGALEELLVLQDGRVVAATTQSGGTLSLHARMLGAGTVRLQAVARFADGRSATSAPVALTIADSGGASGALPAAFSFTERVRGGEPAGVRPFVLQLPATFDDPLASAVYTVVTPPARATLLPVGSGPWRILVPEAGAFGTDTLVFRVTTPAGTSADATIRLDYGGPPVRRR